MWCHTPERAGKVKASPRWEQRTCSGWDGYSLPMLERDRRGKKQGNIRERAQARACIWEQTRLRNWIGKNSKWGRRKKLIEGRGREWRGDGEQRRKGWCKVGAVVEEVRFDGRNDGEKLIQSETFQEVRGKTKRNERRGQAEEKEKGPLVVALGGMIAHLTTDAHELNKLSFPFLCQFPQSSSSQPANSVSHYMNGGKMAGGEVFFFLC